MRRTGKLLWMWLMLAVLCAGTALAEPTDEYTDEYDGGRVARVTVLNGDVQIRRAGQSEWESAAPNLPLLEGDRIATGEDSRLEIQFDERNYLRVAENSLVSIVTLRDEGIALSVPEGAVILRLYEFNRDREYFEIDAPQTTVAARKKGLYRVDAPQDRDDTEVRVTVTDGGEARIYSTNSGFTVRNNRSARIFTEGDYAGEYEMQAAASVYDDFDRWTADREDRIAQRRARNNREYYDASIYGADELGDYGEWVYSNRYGYVWRPYRNSISSYSNWSPYRHGHWRYLSRYGWTWIADEPWGWATSHYGRWVYVDNYWTWSPYDAWRRRSRWQSSLAIFVNVGNNVCWYPIPYNYGYRRNRNGGNTIIYNNTTVIVNNPTAPVANTVLPYRRPPVDPVYAGAVTGIARDKFGKERGAIQPIMPTQGKRAIDSEPVKTERNFILPPTGRIETTVIREREIVGKRETFVKAERELETGRIGASKREIGVALDRKLEQERVTEGRKPVLSDDPPRSKSGNDAPQPEKPRTGVFDRGSDRPPVFRDDTETKNETTERPRRPVKTDEDRPAPRPQKRDEDSDRPAPRPQKRETEDRPAPRDEPKQRDEPRPERPRPEPPVYRPEPKQEREPDRPRYEPPPQREQPRYEPPPQREEPRPDPPQKRDDPPPAPPTKSDDKPGKDG